MDYTKIESILICNNFRPNGTFHTCFKIIYRLCKFCALQNWLRNSSVTSSASMVMLEGWTWTCGPYCSLNDTWNNASVIGWDCLHHANQQRDRLCHWMPVGKPKDNCGPSYWSGNYELGVSRPRCSVGGGLETWAPKNPNHPQHKLGIARFLHVAWWVVTVRRQENQDY